MGLFGKLRQNQYIENMTVLSKTSLSLLNTLNELQQEHEKTLLELERVRADLQKLKAR